MTAVAVLALAPDSAVHAEPSRAEIQQRIDRESRVLSGIVEGYNKANEELKITRSAVASHAAGLPALRRKLAVAEADVDTIAASAYKSGRLRAVEAVLSPRGPAAMADRLGALDHLARGRQADIATFTAARRRHDGEQQRLDRALARQNVQLRDLARRKKKIEADLKRLYALRRTAFGREQESGSRYTGSVPAVSGRSGAVVRYAYNAIGTPYVWAADGPNGYDCSGLTSAAWRAGGRRLPHNAAMQWSTVTHIRRGELVPGDLVFYAGLGHVALYVGNGRVIHAPTFGRRVQLADVDMMRPYGYGRV
ncbi:MAG TPA: NlpC/P60 family protein [Pilimelia sp.]|nr:NlpC/P60 family protein [Pilimelia sp.]